MAELIGIDSKIKTLTGMKERLNSENKLYGYERETLESVIDYLKEVKHEEDTRGMFD